MIACPAVGGKMGPSGSTVTVLVKNTFIDIEERPVTSHVRPASVPALWRMRPSGSDALEGRDLRGRERSVSPRGSPEKALSEDMSTETSAGEEVEDSEVGDASTECGASVHEEQLWSLKTAAPVPTSRPPLVLLIPTKLPAATTLSHQPMPSALNPAARAWEPHTGPKPNRRERSSSNRQIAEITEKICAVLAACFGLTGTEIVKATSGWTVTAEIQKSDLVRKEAILACSKDAMLAAVEASKNMYMLGYRARPFVPTPAGFGAQFVSVADEYAACWGLLQQGYCCHGENCRWKHPTCQVSVNVALKMAGAPRAYA